MLSVVLDTNTFIVSVSSKSNYHWIFSSFLKQKFQLAFTSEILTEYEEQLSAQWHPEVAENTSKILMEAKNSLPITVYFQFNLITVDPDDNKFVDCAIASGADYIFTYEKHFNLLKQINFPKVTVIDPPTFKTILEKRKLI